MSIANRLYDRPHGSNISPVNVPTLYITGKLHGIPPGVAYSGRLQIHNAIGACRAELLSGDLPPGYTLGVDNTTSEVVITWPAYQTGTVEIANAGFANGDDGSWELTAGWSIMQGVTAPDPNDPGNNWQAEFANQSGESEFLHRMRADVTAGRAITVSCDVQQGGSSGNAAGAAVRLVFEDADGKRIDSADGTVVKTGSNSEWHTSNLATTVPTGATKVRIGAAAYRKRQNRPLWVDHFQWDVKQTATGTNTTGTIPLSLRVIDSSGRKADWSGSIRVQPYEFTFLVGTLIADEMARIAYPVADLNDQVLRAGSDTKLYESADGLAWVAVTNGVDLPASQIRRVGATKTAVFANIADGANNGHLYRKKKLPGATWEKITHLDTGGFARDFVDAEFICSDDGILWTGNTGVYLGTPGTVYAMYSADDGDTWAVVSTPSGYNPGDSILAFDGRYIPEWQQWIIPGQGKIYTADSAAPSAIVEALATNRVGSCAYSPSLDCVVVASDAQHVYAKFGKTGAWQTVLVTHPSYIYGIDWIDVLGCFVGFCGHITNSNLVQSFDGITWTAATSATLSITGVNACVYLPWLSQFALVPATDSAGHYGSTLSDI